MITDLEEVEQLLGDVLEETPERWELFRKGFAAPHFQREWAVYIKRLTIAATDALVVLSNMKLEIATLTASRDYMERELEFYKKLYRGLKDVDGYKRGYKDASRDERRRAESFRLEGNV